MPSRYHTDKVGLYTAWDDSTGHHWPNDPPSHVNYPDATITGKDSLSISSGHPFQLLGKTRRNIGGNFLATKHEFGGGASIPTMHHSNVANQPLAKGSGFHYYGPITGMQNVGVNDWPSAPIMTDVDLDARGTTAIARTIPTNPVSGLLVALGELKRDGIPSLLGIQSWRNRTSIARAAGNEYLNHQFGWLPLINDVKRFSNAVTNHDSLIRQYEKNSGRKIKRKLNFPAESTVESTSTSVRSPNPFGGMLINSTYSAECTKTVTLKREVWFSGAYSYYLPPYDPGGNNVRRNEQLSNYLYGTRPTPSALWDLAPWTWAIDWVSNAGDVMTNISAFSADGLVMQYGYVMARTVREVEYYWPHIEYKTYPGVIRTLSYTLRTIVKQRRVATPYGFGLDPSGFSNRQWAILAAIGISRRHKSLD